MYFQALRFSALCGALALITGCGGVPSSNPDGVGGSPAVVTFTITGITPAVVATKVGSGPFTAATLKSGVVTINLPSGVNNFAVAYTCSALPPNGLTGLGAAEQDVYEATTLDGSSFTGSCLPGLAPPTFRAAGMLTGSVDASAIPGVSSFAVEGMGSGYGSSFNFPFTTASSFSLITSTGANRVLVLAYDTVYSPPATAGSTTLAAAKNFDNQTAPGTVNGGNPIVLAPSDETTLIPITYGSLPAGFASQGTTANLVTSIGGTGYILATAATAHYPALPASATENGDYYRVNTIASNGSELTSITTTSSSAAPIAFTFPADWSYAGPIPASMPTFDVTYSGFSGINGITYLASWNWSPANFGGQYSTSVYATGNYLSGTKSIAWPDISGVAGFLSPPASGTYIDWTLAVTQTTYASQPASPANSTVTSVTNDGSYKVP
jgi:hypothetical protein